MRKSLFTVGVGLALAGAAVAPVRAADTGMKTLPGHVPAVVSHLKAKGRLPGDTSLELAIGLPLRNQKELAGLIQRVYDPASPDYGHYLTPAEFTARFGPTEHDYQAVINFAAAHGLTVIGTSPNRMLVDVRGKAGDIEKAFHVTLRTYQHPKENRDFFAADTEPSVPAGLSVLDISGLDNYRRPHPNYRIKPAAASPKTASTANPNAGSGPSGNYMGDDFRHAYVPGTTLVGAGQTIALVQFDGYLASDIHAYETLVGRTNIPLQNVLLNGFSGIPTGNGGEVEVSLDIEMVVSMAPALAKVVVYEGDPNNFHPNDVLNAIATDNTASQISCSWGWTGGPQATTDQIFQQMAIQGQSFFVASGDADAYPPGEVDNPFNFGTPAASPYVTSVGGTTLTMSGGGNNYVSETVWNWGVRFGPAYDGIGSSGGFSSFYALPIWQTNMISSTNGGSATTRNFPDVALTADDVYVIADGGLAFVGTGGTSCASPLWAGFLALVNQYALANGKAPIGFLNPAVYAIANGPNYTTCFHDTRTGNNTWSGSPTLFNAVPGYDLCTGLGTPRTNLINTLVTVSSTLTNSITHISPPPPPYGTNLAGVNGGNPNGSWALYVADDAVLDFGVISNGWWLNLTVGSPVGFSGDNQLTMTNSASSVRAGDTLSYFLTVTNYGPSTSSNVVVSDTLPLGVTLLSSNATLGAVSHIGSSLIWAVGTLATNAGAQLTILVQAPASAGSMLNFATVTANTPDANPDNDVAFITTPVTPVVPPEIAANYLTNGTFRLTVSNPTNPAASTIVFASTNLVNWIPLYTGTPPFTYTDPNASNYLYRFYRAVLGP